MLCYLENIHSFPLCASVIPHVSPHEADRTTFLKTIHSGADSLLVNRSAFRTVLSSPVTLRTPHQIFSKNIEYFRFPKKERAFPPAGDLMSKPDSLLLTTAHRETPQSVITRLGWPRFDTVSPSPTQQCEVIHSHSSEQTSSGLKMENSLCRTQLFWYNNHSFYKFTNATCAAFWTVHPKL